MNGELSAPTKAEAMITESLEIHTSLIDNSHSQLSSLPSRMNKKISREYLTQHITYRAQRLASKVEPDMVDFELFYYYKV
jgi:NADH dehydrogenase FAD-containing subunit